MQLHVVVQVGRPLEGLGAHFALVGSHVRMCVHHVALQAVEVFQNLDKTEFVLIMSQISSGV